MTDRRKTFRPTRKPAGTRWGGKYGFRAGRPGYAHRHGVRSHIIVTAEGRQVFVGPSIQGKPMKLIEVASGEVEDRKPFFV